MKNRLEGKHRPDRRSFLKRSALAAGALATGASIAGPSLTGADPAYIDPASQTAATGARRTAMQEPTRFVHACMTLPYRSFPLDRALRGIKNAGYDHVAWGTEHREEDGEDRPVIAPDADPDEAAELGERCRDLGLEPVKMFSMVYPDDDDAIELLTNRVQQAEAAGIEYVLTFGPVDGGDPERWVEVFSEIGPVAADHDVTVVMKQHGGETTGTGEALARIVEEVDHPNVWMSYDAGNVLWYLEVDPIADIQTCADLIRAFALKDCRLGPEKSTAGPGYGEIDHYRLFEPVAFTGRTITLAYENIHPPYIGQPRWPEQVDEWARLSREYVENIIRGVQEVE